MENKKFKRFKNKELSDDQRRKRRKVRKIIFITTGVILIAFLYFALDFFFRLRSTFAEIYEPLGEEVVDMREEEEEELNLGEDPFTVLILGLDEGRADAMMLATINPNEDSTYLLSIARDTKVTIPGHGVTRINHSYAYGGIDLAVNTVQEFLNVPIDYHASLDMEEFHSLINVLGGVRVYNDTVAFSLGGYDFPLGYIDLTGTAAYYYVRMRMNDPRGDFGRQERQRDVLVAMAGELAGVTVITRYQQVLDAVGESMRTNVTLDEMMTISTNYAPALRNITHLSLRAPGRLINGMYLIPIPEEQRLEMSQHLRQHLELEPREVELTETESIETASTEAD